MSQGSRRRVVFWRHGRTTWNTERRFQGKQDIPLDEVGIEQAQRAARMLAALNPTAIVSSDLKRAHDTARELAKLTGLPITLDPALRERDGGEWEGMTNTEIRDRYPAEYQVWEPVGGESTAQVAKRVIAALEKAVGALDDRGLLVVVSHAATCRLGMLGWLGIPEQYWDAFGGFANCCWSIIEDGRKGWRLVEHNAGTLPEPILSDDQR